MSDPVYNWSFEGQPLTAPGLPLESYRMVFLDFTEYGEEVIVISEYDKYVQWLNEEE